MSEGRFGMTEPVHCCEPNLEFCFLRTASKCGRILESSVHAGWAKRSDIEG